MFYYFCCWTFALLIYCHRLSDISLYLTLLLPLRDHYNKAKLVLSSSFSKIWTLFWKYHLIAELLYQWAMINFKDIGQNEKQNSLVYQKKEKRLSLPFILFMSLTTNIRVKMHTHVALVSIQTTSQEPSVTTHAGLRSLYSCLSFDADESGRWCLLFPESRATEPRLKWLVGKSSFYK